MTIWLIIMGFVLFGIVCEVGKRAQQRERDQRLADGIAKAMREKDSES